MKLGIFVSFNPAKKGTSLAITWHQRSGSVCQRVSYCLRRQRSGGRISAAWPHRVAYALLLLTSLLTLASSSFAQRGENDEYRAKANFLAAFPRFIEWPADTFSSSQKPFLLCVYGTFSFGTSLAELTRGNAIRGHKIEVTWVRKEQELRACQILFVSGSEAGRYKRIFKAIQGANVLTVGETPDFLTSGGAINFLFEKNRLQFEVNLDAANEAKLQISSNMLVLARHVVARAEVTKS